VSGNADDSGGPKNIEPNDILDKTKKVENFDREEYTQLDEIKDALKKMAVNLAKMINAKAIISLTETGSAHSITKLHPLTFGHHFIFLFSST
jgi:pyruvate kinase